MIRSVIFNVHAANTIFLRPVYTPPKDPKTEYFNFDERFVELKQNAVEQQTHNAKVYKDEEMVIMLHYSNGMVVC